MSSMRPPNAPAPRRNGGGSTRDITSLIRGVKSSMSVASSKEYIGPLVSGYRGSSCSISTSRNITPLRLDPLASKIRGVPDTHLDTASPCPSDVSDIHLSNTRQNTMIPDQEFPHVRQTDNWSGRPILPPVSARDQEASHLQPPFASTSANSLSPYNNDPSPYNSSLGSRNSSTHTRQGKKRALSISPISLDNIRTSPTSLVAYINGAGTQSSPLMFGSQGHLTARCSPSSRGSSSESTRKTNFLHADAHKQHKEMMAEIMNNQMITRPNLVLRSLQPALNIKTEPSSAVPSGAASGESSPEKKPPAAAEQSPTIPEEEEEAAEERICCWSECNAVFGSQEDLVRHIEKAHIDHRKGEEFTCYWAQCPRQCKPFNARYKLLIHMRVHSGEKPNKCTFEGCTKAFSRLENLKIHLRSHTGERPYKCTFPKCTKAFSNSSDRAKHFRTHEDTKPYACEVPGCAKRYTDPSSLRKHHKSHTKEEQQARKKVKASKESGAELNSLLSVRKFTNSPLPPKNETFGMHFGQNAHYAGQGNVNLAELNYMTQHSQMEEPNLGETSMASQSDSALNPYMTHSGGMVSEYPPPPYPGLHAPQQPLQMQSQAAWLSTEEQWQTYQQQQMAPPQQSASHYAAAGAMSCAQEAAMAALGPCSVRQLSPRHLQNVNVDEAIPYITPETQVQAYKIEAQPEGYQMYHDPQLLERQNSTLSARPLLQQPMYSVDGGGM